VSVASSPSRIEGRLRALFAQAGARGWLHAVDLDAPSGEVAVDADQPVALASVFKVAVLVELFRQADRAVLDLAEQVPVPVHGRTRGVTGLAAMRDPARLSLRDLAFLMMTVSDVAATDVLLDRIGLDAVNATLEALGLARTRLRGTCADMLALVREDLALSDDGQLADRLAGAASRLELRALDPERTSGGTARELTSLLAAIWRDEAAEPASCAEMRAIMAAQVWPHRLAAGFPSDAMAVAGKTGTLPTLRNEVGVVEFPDERRYAVAVFTRSDSLAPTLPQVDAVIGVAARVAVDDIRRRAAPHRPGEQDRSGLAQDAP